MLVRDVANNFFQQIFKRNDALQPTVLVDDETEMRFGLLHLPEHILQSRCVDHVQGGLKHILEAETFRSEQVRHHVFTMNKADHVIERFAVNRQARVTILLESLGYLRQIAITGDRRHLRSRHHSLAHQRVRKLEDAMDQPSFFSAQVTAFARHVYQLPEFGFCINRSVIQTGPESNQPPQRAANGIEQPKRRAKDSREQFQGSCRKHRYALGTFQSNHLWHQLSEHDMQETDDAERNHNGHYVCQIASASFGCDSCGQRMKQVRNSWFANPPKCQ